MTNSANVKIELIKRSYNQEKIIDIAQNDLIGMFDWQQWKI